MLGGWRGGVRARVVYREAYEPGLGARRQTSTGSVHGGRRAQAVYNKVGTWAQGKEADAPMWCTGRQTCPGLRQGCTHARAVSGGWQGGKRAGLRMHLVINEDLLDDMDWVGDKDGVNNKDS